MYNSSTLSILFHKNTSHINEYNRVYTLKHSRPFKLAKEIREGLHNYLFFFFTHFCFSLILLRFCRIRTIICHSLLLLLLLLSSSYLSLINALFIVNTRKHLFFSFACFYCFFFLSFYFFPVSFVLFLFPLIKTFCTW